MIERRAEILFVQKEDQSLRHCSRRPCQRARAFIVAQDSAGK